MTRSRSKLWLRRYAGIVLGFLGLGLLASGVVTIAAWTQQMDAPTWLVSWIIPKVTVQELIQNKLKLIIIVDVRSLAEYQTDHIAQSVLIPLTAIEDRTGIGEVERLALITTQPDYTRPAFVLYDNGSERSVQAYEKLKVTQLKLFVLSGGLKAWRQQVPPSQDAPVLKQMVVPIPQRSA